MELVSIENSRVISLFRTARLDGQLYLPRAAEALSGRYRFSEYPETYRDLSGDAAEFRHGIFQDAAIDLGIYNDGVIVTSRSNTNLLDEFLNDLREMLHDNLGLSTYHTQPVNMIYESTLLIQSEEELLAPLNKLSNVSKDISRRLYNNSEIETEYTSFGFSFATDVSKIPGTKPLAFRIERPIGVDFSFNQYLSTAPLKTDDHLEVLRLIENSV